MHTACVEINSVPTMIETWGRWIEESPLKQNETIILCIPGNPGVTSYYRKFLNTLHEKLQCPVWIIGHAGHQMIDSTYIKGPSLKGNEKLYDVEGQVKHKEEFFRKYIPENAKVYLVGHSIGAYISLQLLKNPEIKKKVEKAYLMFPTIEDMAETPNGQFLINTVKYFTTILYFLSWIFTFFPYFVQTTLLYGYFRFMRQSVRNITPTRDLIHPDTLQKIFFMAYDEMEVVRNLDGDLITSNKGKIKLYYGATDNWSPASYCVRLQQKFPDVDAEICVRQFAHAFVLYKPEEVGNMVAGWISN